MRETWYLLVDGTVADPNEVAPDEAGILRHSSGVAVAYSAHGPRSRGVDPDEERAKALPRDLKPEPTKRGYKTRETKTGS